MKKFIGFLGACGVVVLAGCGTQQPAMPADTMTAANTSLERVDIIDFKEAIANGYTVIDVRTPEEFADGSIAADALNIDYYDEDFMTQMSTLPRDGEYAIYCRSGNRSGQALEAMQVMGFENVVELDGGIMTWASAGNDVVAPTCAVNKTC